MNNDHRWPIDKARAWEQRTGWLVGCNYTPAYAVNQLEMWQAQTYDPAAIGRELDLAADLGFNSLRVFLHDLVYATEANAFLDRIDDFLGIAASRGIGIMPVFFDSVWHPFPHAGPQRDPEPGVHNSGWVQSPGVLAIQDPALFDRLEPYVTAVVERFADDERVQAWDVWNEPDNANRRCYGPREFDGPDAKGAAVLPLFEKAVTWIRDAGPSQPLTAGLWTGDHDRLEDATTLPPLQQAQLAASDIVSFHWYGNAERTADRIAQFAKLDRPMVCTEFMARTTGNTFAGVLPTFKEHHVGGHCWGLVRGRTQTHLPWDTWAHPDPSDAGPTPWHHDVFHEDHTPYDEAEVAFLRETCRSD